ncbi:regulator of chromosome condensation (RCC1) family with FYVE zinc finger domain-containing protein [Actinidia rufa]|uniref:Regulator of chromosome condensation (RCC1) family with FYVE zinc finger domain-containing protein n=1 Tax=Actinidia rufa TaxID=165716 RepID=A0A7J0F7T8_9ERIC|nr:regulator of chromosome condensation (RCC1) family with FYVE zinc finger domain-containing protein [Actinidia rufa]
MLNNSSFPVQICKDKDEADKWFSGLKAIISRGHQRKWRTESRSDGIPSEANSPRTYTQRSSPLNSPFGSGDSLQKDDDDGDQLCLHSPYESPPKNGLDKAFSDVILHAVPPKSFFPSESASGSVHSLSSGGSDGVHGHLKGMGMDAYRLSLSSAVSSSSHGSGHDDGDALGDVFIWGKGLAAVVLDVQNMACGGRHAALVTKQGEIFSWGEESGGRLGHGVDSDVLRPKLIDSLSHTSIELVACGEYHTCAVTLSGDLYTWGDGHFGLLGHGNEVSHWVPKLVNWPLEGIHVSSLSCGPWHTAVVTSSGQLFTFGDGTFGVLGHGDRRSVSKPREVESLKGLRTVRAACGVWHTAAVVEVMVGSSSSSNCSLGKLFTWGDGDKGRLGHGDRESKLVPTCVAALVEPNFCKVSCGHSLTVALTSSGHVYTMGSPVYGQLGNPQADGKLPIRVEGKLSKSFVEEIACGAYHVAVLTSRTEVYSWGKGTNGRLGHGDTHDRSSPTLVEALKDKQVKSIACGTNFTTAICLHNKKSLKASMAPNPNKSYRVCDTCFDKLKKAFETDASSHSSIFYDGVLEARGKSVVQRETRNWNSVAAVYRLFEMEVPNGELLTSLNLFNPVFGSSKKFFSASVPGSRIVSRATSPISRRASPPRSATPIPTLGGFASPKFNVEDTMRPNDSLSQEVITLRAQVENLTRKAQIQELELGRTSKQLKEAITIAGEETAKCKAAKEVIKSLTAQLKDMAERLPMGAVQNIKPPSIISFGSNPISHEVSNACVDRLSGQITFQASDANGSNGPLISNGSSIASNHSSGNTRQGQSETTTRNGSKMRESDSHNDNEQVEQDDPGVYITLTSLPGGSKDLKRVRFSRKRFSEKQAEQWWAENRARVYERYNVRMVDKSNVGVGSEDFMH